MAQVPLLDAKTVPKVDTFSGKFEDWREWKFGFVSYISLLGGGQLLREAAAQPGEIVMSELTAETLHQGHLLYHLLVQITRGKARQLAMTHERMADEKMPSLYQRAVILYRDPEDNLEANLRYLEKSSNPKVAEACGDLDFGQWVAADSDGYHTFEEMHYVAHRRFYCHAQRYPVPRLFVTYSALLSDPLAGFREIYHIYIIYLYIVCICMASLLSPSSPVESPAERLPDPAHL